MAFLVLLLLARATGTWVVAADLPEGGFGQAEQKSVKPAEFALDGGHVRILSTAEIARARLIG
jgi:hypothetical protein